MHLFLIRIPPLPSPLLPPLPPLGLDCCAYCYTTRAISTRVMENTTICETKTSDNVFVRVDVAVQQQYVHSSQFTVYRGYLVG